MMIDAPPRNIQLLNYSNYIQIEIVYFSSLILNDKINLRNGASFKSSRMFYLP